MRLHLVQLWGVCFAAAKLVEETACTPSAMGGL
jgi:hypothetical protein